LRDNGLLVERKKKYVKTTNSIHRFRVYTNLIKEIKIIRINQVIVSDITYIQTEEGYLYLALITEMYSRMIIGHDVSESLSIEGSLRALRQAIKKIKQTEGMNTSLGPRDTILQ
jgi:transposase InsO family protein